MVGTLLSKLIGRSVNKTAPLVTSKRRKWRLWQVEPTLACNLKCIMCPWEGLRLNPFNNGQMSEEIWAALTPFLPEVESVDFTGSGEPLMQKHLLQWIGQAKTAGCQVGFLTNGLLLNEGLIQKLIDLSLDWLGFSVDGADRETYEAIRRGADFEKVCRNINLVTASKRNQKPLVMINFVMMRHNQDQLEKIVRLAHQLKVDQINFKQCDVSRADNGHGHGLYAAFESKEIKKLQKTLSRATRLAGKLGLRTTAFSFLPDEQPVCVQDPRTSLFIRFDGYLSPCINVAYGGPSAFLGQPVDFPTYHYGKLPEEKLPNLWQSASCDFFKQRFQQRVTAHDRTLETFEGHSLVKLLETFKKAIDAMPEAPDGCKTCHYLFNI